MLIDVGTWSTWPMVSVLFVRLLSLFNVSTVVLNFWAMEYRVSPLDTLYVFVATSFGAVYGMPL